MNHSLVLVVDDDPGVRGSIQALLRAEAIGAETAGSAEEALARLASGASPDVIVADLHLPGADGLALLDSVRERRPDIPFVLVTAHSGRDVAVSAMERGVADFLVKPVNDDELLFRLRRLLETSRLRRENETLKSHLNSNGTFSGLVGHHPAMQRIFRTVEAVAETRATLLVHGESGTGKTMLARALHLHSDRRDGPFVEVACGALPEDLIESELFGHVRGSFTGAIADRRGKVEGAHGGTLFLDEIGVASQALQVKLLRVLQERAFERVGSSDTIRVDIRLVLATNMNLEEEVRRGAFREDLFYRINVVTVDLPPLRDRIGDLPTLAHHFLEKYRVEHGRPQREFHPEVIPVLCRYEWPGNIRQLENVIERSVILAQGDVITPHDLPPAIQSAGPGPARRSDAFLSLQSAMDGEERDYLRRVLAWTRGNRNQAADILGINRSTLFNKMRKFELFGEDFGNPS